MLLMVFHALTNDNIKEIVKLHINYLQDRLETKKLHLEPTKEALDLLSKEGYDPKYGARPVRRVIQELVEDPLTSKYLDGEFKDGDTVQIIRKQDKIELSRHKVPVKAVTKTPKKAKK